MIKYNLLRNPNRTLFDEAQYRFYQDKIDEETFNRLNSIYPKYSEWILKMYLNKDPNATVDPSILRVLLEKYAYLHEKRFWSWVPAIAHEYRPDFIESITKLRDLQDVSTIFQLHALVGSKIVSEFQEEQKYKNYKKESEYTVILSDDMWFIALPENFMACILFGGGDFGDGSQTRWCVSSKSNSSEENYKNYTNDMEGHCPIVFIQSNNPKYRWLAGGNDDLINNEQNVALSKREADELFKSLPPEAVVLLDEKTEGSFTKLMTETHKELMFCDYCGGRIEDDEFFGVEDETWCQGCYESNGFYCERCNENKSVDGAEFTDTEHLLCKDCASGLSNCDDCGKLIDDEDKGRLTLGWCDSGGTCYCCNCWENHSICGECNNFTDDSKEGDDGDYYCPDCIGEHRETPAEEEPEEEGSILEVSKQVFRFKRLN